MSLYSKRRIATVLFLSAVFAVVAAFLFFSNKLIDDLASQERERMEIWADATKRLGSVDSGFSSDVDFLLDIIERNHTIPVMLVDSAGNILLQRNFSLPDPLDSINPNRLSERNAGYLSDKLSALRLSDNRIEIAAGDTRQTLLYEDSRLLQRLSIYPYLQVLILLAFIATVYFALSSTLRAEQNKVWAGLSKETAHQLGTPISSLLAWIEILRETDIPQQYIEEINKDVVRLSTIASRFSKIGSEPSLELRDLNDVAGDAVSYMSSRIPPRVELKFSPSPSPLPVAVSPPLFEWVIENLVKNGVDAMQGKGTIEVRLTVDGDFARLDVSDTGKGIPRKNIGSLFNPGFTTKKRGWGLGLTFAYRIVRRYHHGTIFVSRSEIGKGTTFTIRIPLKS